VTVKPVPVASHALPPQPARPTATATAAPVKKVAPPAVAPTLPKVNIPAAEKGTWRCDWQRLTAVTAVTGRGQWLAVTEFCPMPEYNLKTVFCYFHVGHPIVMKMHQVNDDHQSQLMLILCNV
jgi:3-oxoacyl-[acyl-carrier protein] reductase